jgi:hypothetical protein
MFRIKRTSFSVAALALFFIFAGYSSGVANFSNLGQTGAPNGDGDLEGNCGVCHNTGNFGESTSFLTTKCSVSTPPEKPMR